MFIKKIGFDIIILLIYVDDILLTGSNSSLHQHFISSLHAIVSLKYLGSLHFSLVLRFHIPLAGCLSLKCSLLSAFCYMLVFLLPN